MYKPAVGLLVVAAALLAILLAGCSDEPTPTPIPTPTNTPSSAPTSTATAAPTDAPAPTPTTMLNTMSTDTLAPTSTAAAIPMPTDTPTPTATPKPTPTPTPTPIPTVISLEVTEMTPLTSIGEKVQLSVTANMSDGSSQVVENALVQWQSSDPWVASQCRMA